MVHQLHHQMASINLKVSTSPTTSNGSYWYTNVSPLTETRRRSNDERTSVCAKCQLFHVCFSKVLHFISTSSVLICVIVAICLCIIQICQICLCVWFQVIISRAFWYGHTPKRVAKLNMCWSWIEFFKVRVSGYSNRVQHQLIRNRKHVSLTRSFSHTCRHYHCSTPSIHIAWQH